MKTASNNQLAEEFGGLGYPGYAYLGKTASKFPANILLDALSRPALEPRLIEALPWLLSEYWQVLPTLVNETRKLGCQNKLGFLVGLARQIPWTDNQRRRDVMTTTEKQLETFLIEEESSFYAMSEAEKDWIKKRRTAQAAHWRILSSLKPEDLDYYFD